MSKKKAKQSDIEDIRNRAVADERKRIWTAVLGSGLEHNRDLFLRIVLEKP